MSAAAQPARTTTLPSQTRFEPGRLASVDAARAVASLSVAVFHIPPFFYPPESHQFLYLLLECLRVAVPMLFVVSGYAISQVLTNLDSRSRSSGNSRYAHFLVQRFVRLYAPYAIYVVLVLGIFAVGTAIRSPHKNPLPHSASTLLANFTWTAGFLDLPWLQYHFYALPIVFQFYFWICLAGRWILASSYSSLATMAAFGFSPLIVGNRNFVFFYLPTFLLGVLAFWRRQQPSGASLVPTLLLATLYLGMIGVTWGPIRAVGAFAAFLIIMQVNLRVHRLSQLATMSYSLYLVHPIVIHLLAINGPQILGRSQLVKLILFFSCLPAALVTAWFFHRYVEGPLHKYAKRIHPATG